MNLYFLFAQMDRTVRSSFTCWFLSFLLRFLFFFFNGELTKNGAATEKSKKHCDIVKDLEGEQSSWQLLHPRADRFLRLGDEATIKQRVVLCCVAENTD